MVTIKEESIGIGGRNMNKIGWCSETFNPCWGCLGNCPYCYSRRIAKRFWKLIAKKEYRYWLDNALPDSDYAAEGIPKFLKEFRPIFLYSQFHKNLPKKPQRIFVGSMSEIYYWEDEWVEKVLEKVKQYPQHIFQFLTKYPEIYKDWVWPKNCWLGVTITKNPKDRESGRWNYHEYK